jgi:hypothetical protein
LDSDKADSASLSKLKNETANAKMVGEKMKAAKEASDAMVAAKAEKANNAKEADTEAGIKRNQEMLDGNKAAMEKDMAASIENKKKPAGEQPPVGVTGSTQSHTDSENWAIDMP